VNQTAMLALIIEVRIVAIGSVGTAANTNSKSVAPKARVGDS
jgi:hypothetical protein